MYMTKYREILRLHSLGFSQQNIAYSSNVSKKTVNRVINRAKELKLFWPLDDSKTDASSVNQKVYHRDNQKVDHPKADNLNC
jgi:DNA-directed RNA polymerase specialized sigma subunit, sigma24 homolog